MPLRAPDLSIRARLVTATALLLAAAALAPLAVLPDRLEGQASAAMERRALDLASALGKASEVALDFADRQRASEILGGLASVEGAVAGELTGADGRPLAAWGAPLPPSPRATPAAASIAWTDALLRVEVPVSTPTGALGIISIGFDLSERVRRREEARGVVAATAITVFLGGLAAFFLVATFLTKPVRTLSRLATRIARGDEGAVRDLETGLAGEAGAVAAALEGVVGKLEAQRAMLQSQSEATDEGILTVDPAGRLITHNRRLRELFGLSREELGASWAALRPRLEAALAAPLPGWLAAPAPALPEGERASFDVATRDGRTLSVHASTVRTASGAALGLGLYLRDLTGRVRDRRRIEELAESLERRVEARTREVEAKNAELARSLEELRRTQEQLVVADRRISLGRLAAGVAHEVNNPLAYLLANVRWVADGLGEIAARDAAAPGAGRPAGDDAPPALEEMRRALADAAEGAVRVGHIVRGLNQFARGDDDAVAPVALDRAVDAALGMAAHEVRHRARLVRERAPAPAVLANEVRLSQVVLNLLINAAHAIPPGADASNAVTVVTGTDPDGWAFVEVRDTGTGIAPEILGRIFDPFFTTKPQGVGSGLGLSISQGIVTSLGGTIGVESAPGRGAAFRVRLPPAGPDARAPALTPPPAFTPAPPRARVLIVDDEPLVAQALKRLLEKEHAVALSGCGEEALARVRAGERFDHILCDLMMPGMKGMDLFAALGGLAPDQAARMIFMTGGAFTEATTAFVAVHRDRLVEKPVDPTALRRIMHANVRP